FGGYEGIVEIWDEKGAGKDPVQDTDDRFEVVNKGDAWMIREFPRTIPERGAKSRPQGREWMALGAKLLGEGPAIVGIRSRCERRRIESRRAAGPSRYVI